MVQRRHSARVVRARSVKSKKKTKWTNGPNCRRTGSWEQETDRRSLALSSSSLVAPRQRICTLQGCVFGEVSYRERLRHLAAVIVPSLFLCKARPPRCAPFSPSFCPSKRDTINTSSRCRGKRQQRTSSYYVEMRLYSHHRLLVCDVR